MKKNKDFNFMATADNKEEKLTRLFHGRSKKETIARTINYCKAIGVTEYLLLNRLEYRNGKYEKSS